MKEFLERIRLMTDYELQDVMKAIEARYAAVYPEWEVLYIALHKDPVLREKELEAVQTLLARDPQQCRELTETAP